VRELLITIIIVLTAPAIYADFVDPPGLKDRYHGMAYDVLDAAYGAMSDSYACTCERKPETNIGIPEKFKELIKARQSDLRMEIQPSGFIILNVTPSPIPDRPRWKLLRVYGYLAMIDRGEYSGGQCRSYWEMIIEDPDGDHPRLVNFRESGAQELSYERYDWERSQAEQLADRPAQRAIEDKHTGESAEVSKPVVISL
jgi:hypothetical protein